jgi:putative peptide-modifying radical SAM enzyme
MFFHVILTDDCNLCCRYCRGKEFDLLPPGDGLPAIDLSMPSELCYRLEDLYSFLKKDPGSCLIFYGGEPLVRIDMVRKIMDGAPVNRFLIQTNGLLLDELENEYLDRLEAILVSIDGPEEITDLNRGQGTFSRVVENIDKVRRQGFQGEIIARMTVTEGTDIYQAVRYLCSDPACHFSSVHWQIDADFSCNCRQETFKSWISENYIPGIRKLIAEWVLTMEREGYVPRWYPFLQTAEDLLRGESSRLRCGCGYASYTITTDGNICPCPIMVGMKDYYVGHITTADPRNLPVVNLEGACAVCPIYGFCGGRCLYADVTRPWQDEQKQLICSTVHDLKNGIIAALPAISDLISRGTITLQDFAHTRFNGCEIIP